MFTLFLVFVQLLIVIPIYSVPVEYGLKATRESSSPITKFVLFSERCSGSNYLFKLLKSNFIIESPHFCHKHYPPWYDLPADVYQGNPASYNFEGTENYLFVIIYRNPYDWVRSFFETPWEASDTLKGIPFSQFIRTPWNLNPTEQIVINQMNLNPLVDLNPKDGTPFKNVLKLRTAKAKNMYKISQRAKNTYLINYETVRDHPQEVINEIKSIFNLPSTQVYHPVDGYYKGGREVGTYTPKTYPPFTKKDLEHINSQLDKKFEKKIGYKLIHDPRQIP